MSRSREVYIYDGRECLGRIAAAANGKVRVFDNRGESVGTFDSFDVAEAALWKCVRKAA